MKYYLAWILFLGSVILFISGCTQDESKSGLDPKPDAELPEHIQSFENVTIYSGDAEPAYEIKLIRDQIFRGSNEFVIGRAGAVLVDRLDQVYLADNAQLTIHVFSADGRYLSNIGRNGEGPGEFRSVNHLMTDTDKLYAYDTNTRRISTFSIDTHEYVQTIYLLPENQSSIYEEDGLESAFPLFPHVVRSDGTFLVQFTQIKSPTWEPEEKDVDGYSHYYLLSPDGSRLIDKVFERKISFLLPLGNSLIPGSSPFDRTTLLTVSEDDKLFSAWSEDFLINEHDSHGNYLRAFYYPLVKRVTSRQEVESNIAPELHNLLRSVNIPETWPALQALIIDDENRLWVSTIVEDDEIYEWWVLEDTGELITKFEWPRDEPIEVVRNGYMYTRETEEETDIQQIVRYRIEMEEIE